MRDGTKRATGSFTPDIKKLGRVGCRRDWNFFKKQLGLF